MDFSHVPSQPAGISCPRSMLSCDKRLQPETWNPPGLQEKRFLQIHVRRVSHCKTPHQGTHPCMAPNAAGEASALISTGRPVAREEERIGSTIPMPTFCKQAADHEVLHSCGYPTELCGWAAKTADIFNLTNSLLHKHF